ncbi:PA14 domain-containing protein [Chitinophaga polysaccharea]|uniref:PA14 domain-containing protein n=1 Tax=Chitinophaga polysaccharea TaxID=1293035 RepID=A0A561Q4W6_9BACT|nr:DUF5977 domain-containing protein [Chitinophaga polysaccharea]TWF45398.1 PA14 domain-containing protein [Chitinophaga polysaccharea]
MILALAARGKKIFAGAMLAVVYLEIVIPLQLTGAVLPVHMPPVYHTNSAATISKVLPVSFRSAGTAVANKATTSDAAASDDLGGPTQPEMEQFHGAGNDNMVDLFTGDFTYNIPLLDVGGYPITLGYNSGINMDQEASWVGLGWNINPGTITRNMRGLPDDFNGKDSVTKEVSIKENRTVGISGGGDIEFAGNPINLGLGASIGVFKNSYRGLGIETSVNAFVSAGAKAKGSFTGGLSMTNNSQEGLSISPTLGVGFSSKESESSGGFSGNLSVGASYNSRSGMKALQVSGGVRSYSKKGEVDAQGSKYGTGTSHGASYSFAYPGYTPTIRIPYTSSLITATFKVGAVFTVVHPSFFASGYVTNQYIADADKKLTLPAYGYLNYQSSKGNLNALLDFNREKEIPFREKPAVPNIAIPSYTFDIFSISGEGTGGSFRAYRNDIGYVFDHQMTTRDKSFSIGGDIGVGAIFHAGVDVNVTRAFTRSAAWENDNPLAATVGFRRSDTTFEAAYFRNPGEKTINATSFYDAMGGDRLVTPRLRQDQLAPAVITSTNKLTTYQGGKPDGDIFLNKTNVVKPAREKRTQIITYLTAKEAAEVGLSKYIENYQLNTYPGKMKKVVAVDEYYGDGDGLQATYFNDKDFRNPVINRVVPRLNFPIIDSFNVNRKPGEMELGEDFSSTYSGKLKVPQSGAYFFKFDTDDGFEFKLNGEDIFSNMAFHSHTANTYQVNLEGGKQYDLFVKYFNAGKDAVLQMSWWSAALGPNPDFQVIPANKFFLQKNVDSFVVNNISYEKRVNSFRKADHISEIDVLNSDGRRYIYGIPVYNLGQKEATFSVEKVDANATEGLVKYTPTVDDATSNKKGNDHYYNGDSLPPYAHSYLLTGILTPDYVDIKGDGITDDDPGNAIKFNYTKVAGQLNPYQWRSPYTDSATYNEGMRTDSRDDKGSYVSGTKELWYLNSVESKNMVAVFRLEQRKDLLQMNNRGAKSDGGAKRLSQIDLYTKADFLKPGVPTPVKTVHFEYTYELCPGSNGFDAQHADSGKLTLKRVWFSYNGDEKNRRNAYVFNYNKLNPSYSARKYDRWGNYKDPLQNPGSTAGNLITNAEYPYALQDSTLAAASVAAWTLDSIVMPSGGRLKVNYESDDYAYVQNKRAMQMCKIAGFSANAPGSTGDLLPQLYRPFPLQEYLYVGINVPYAVKSKGELYARYLDGIDKVYFRMYVKMPTDKFGGGYESVPCYARIDTAGGYGFINNGQTIWVKLSGVDKQGNDGSGSPLSKAATEFLRLNLPSKAYPGSDVGDDPDPADAVKVLLTQVPDITAAIRGFEMNAKGRGWACGVDLNRSVVRLNNPYFKKYGGGHRVKSILTYDRWNKMTGQRESVYGKEYQYTTTKIVNGDTLNISSGVAAYEPVLGGEENPWHLPLEYREQVSVLAPVNIGYTEEPLGESFFPAPTVGYSKVRVRTINAKKNRSVNGYDETCFYTTKDFPTLVEHTPINDDTKKNFRNPLGSLLKIYAQRLVTVSQGFKIELNDMNGKLRSQASYAESDPDHWIAYTENFYRVDNPNNTEKHLDNKVLTISPKGLISTSLVGKDMDLMLDMREERSLTNAFSVNANSDFFLAGIWPVDWISLIPLPQRDESVFRSVAATKVITRHGILDSVVVVDKGSRVVTRNLLFDEETGEPVLTSIQNEFNDPVFNFTYPAGWIYEGMSGAYKNVGLVMDHINIKEGRIVSGLNGSVNNYFISGDELLVYAKRKVAGTDCAPEIARWPIVFKSWAVDANLLKGGTPDIYFVNEDGSPLTGNDVSLKIIRSGRKNINVSAGSVSMLRNPLVQNGNRYDFVLNNSSQIINASVTEFKDTWKVPDRKKQGIIIDTFRNAALSRTYVVTCGANTQNVTITVDAGQFKSVVSQRMADELAADYLDFNGEYLAKQKVPCTYFYSKADSAWFQKAGCSPGVGEAVFYRVKAGADSSTVDQATADALARTRLNTEGQAYANSTGRCIYYNTPQSNNFTRNDCPNNLVGNTIAYTLPAGTDSSYISVADANAKTLQKVNSGGQAYANANANCVMYIKLSYTNPGQTGGTHGTGKITKYADVVLSLYADEACTIPYNATNLTVFIAEAIRTLLLRPGQTIDNTQTIDLSYVINGSSLVLPQQTTSTYDSYQNADGSTTSVTDTYTYTITPDPAYIIK